MTQQTIIRSACYLCEGTIEFPAELANQVIPCPHCGKEIKLFAASKSSSRIGGIIGEKWNGKQVLLTLAAVGLLLITLLIAPWEITYRHLDLSHYPAATVQSATIEFGPVFNPPRGNDSTVTAYKLMVFPIALEWAGILTIYLAALLLLRTRDVPLLPARIRERVKHEVAGALQVAPWIAGGIGIVLVIAVIVVAWRDATARQQKAKQQSAALDSPKWEDTSDKPATFSFEEALGPEPAKTIVEIPGVGSVEFPVSMSTGEIAKAAGMLYSNRSIAKRDIFDEIADAQKTLVTGTWTWIAQSGATSVPARKITLKLTANGERLAGTLTPPPSERGGAQPIAAEISDGRVIGNEIWFSIKREFNGNTFVTKYSGKVEGNTILGKIETPGRNGSAPLLRDWEAKRDGHGLPPSRAAAPGAKKLEPFDGLNASERRRAIVKRDFTDTEDLDFPPARNSIPSFGANRYDPDSLANPYGAGSPYKADGLMNPYSQYGSPYSSKSWRNPYATDTPRLYDSDGNYRGKLSSNPYDADSVSNPYGRYGSPYSSDSIRNPYGAGNPYLNSPIYVVPSR